MRRCKAGFTLIEMMIVALMVGIIFAALGGLISSAQRSISSITKEVKKGREGPAILKLIEQDLANAYADPRMPEMFEADESGEGTELRFVTSRNSILFVNGSQSDLTEVGYKVEPNKDSDGLLELWRREDFSMDDDPLRGGLWIMVADNIVEFTCEFYDLPEEGVEVEEEPLSQLKLGDTGLLEARTSWDSSDRRLPYAVKIILRVDIREGVAREYFEEGDSAVQTYVSIVRLPPFSRIMPELEDEEFVARLNAPPADPNANNNANNNGNNNANNNNNNNNANNR